MEWGMQRILQDGVTAAGKDSVNAVIFFGISMILGIASRHLLSGTRVPYTVALLLLGIGLGVLEHRTGEGLGRFGDGIRLWCNIDPDLLLAVFLPALLFESSFLMEVHQIKRCFMQMFLLAGPGVAISTMCLGAVLKLLFPYNWNWTTSLLLGGVLSATDTVAVLALLKDLGASKKLKTIIEGESLMNDGTSIVVYQLFYRMILGWSINLGGVIEFMSKVSLGAVGLGIAFGIASVFWLGFVFNDTVIEISLTVAVSYIAFFVSQETLHVSGMLAVMALGMFYSAFARTAFKGESQRSLHHFWEMVAYIANTLIFILSGVVIAECIFKDDKIFNTHVNSWGWVFLLYVFVILSRFIVVGALFPLLQYFGYGMDWREAIFLIWSGMRGAVALSLSLSVMRTSENSPFISANTGYLFVFLTGGIVLLTLIVNGSTAQFVLHALKLDMLSSAKKRILKYTKYEMLNEALQAFGNLGEDEELGPADWPTVKQHIKCLDNVGGDRTHPHSALENDTDFEHLNLEDTRIRFLNGVQAAYWVMLDEGRITQSTANLLMQSIDEAMDQISYEPLHDWRSLKSHVSIPNHYKFLQYRFIPRKLATYLTVERLDTACYICAAFLRAHRIARDQLRDFIGDSEVANVVIIESELEAEEPRRFLEDVRMTFPQVLRVVKTRQVTYSVLNHLIEYVHNLQKIGLIEEKEMTHLDDAVQTDLKRLLRKRPMIKTPKVQDLIAVNPFLGALPDSVRKLLVGSTKEIIKLSGTTLYKEGSKPSGIWLISSGVVKWSSKSIRHNYSLHPTFTHGSTLGLYEVMAGKSYICDVTTDSVVLCFFLETEKIHSACKSDPVVEDFFWQESVIGPSRLILPHIFEKMTMQELRTLIAERSTMSIYITGETYELPQHSIGFLLEGFIKHQGGHEEVLTAPTALLPSSDQGFDVHVAKGTKLRGISHQGSTYQAMTRSRIITFDLAGFDTGRALQRRQSSLIPNMGDRPSGSFLRRERSNLMIWSEQDAKPKVQDLETGNHQKKNLSTRAMQLSIYGSMLDIGERPAPRPSPIALGNVKTQLYLELIGDPEKPRPIASVKSEGSSTLRNKIFKHGSEPSVVVPLTVTGLQNESSTDAGKDDLSDDSGGEDGHIVRIDSPSRLSFRQAL